MPNVLETMEKLKESWGGLRRNAWTEASWAPQTLEVNISQALVYLRWPTYQTLLEKDDVVTCYGLNEFLIKFAHDLEQFRVSCDEKYAPWPEKQQEISKIIAEIFGYIATINQALHTIAEQY